MAGAAVTRATRALDAAEAVDAECMILTTGPAGRLTWEDAADALAEALGPIVDDAAARHLPFGLEHTNSLRVDVGFVHTLADAVDLARRLGIGVCVETTPAGPSGASARRSTRASTRSASCR